MAINIMNRETEELLEEIRTLTGKGIADIVLDLAREEAARLRAVSERTFLARLARLEAISHRAAAKVLPDAATPEDIIGYDERGLPT